MFYRMCGTFGIILTQALALLLADWDNTLGATISDLNNICKQGEEHGSWDSVFCCGNLPFNPLNATCCTGRNGNKQIEVYDEQSKECCGPPHDQKLFNKKAHHLCCGKQQYDRRTQHCCVKKDDSMEVKSISVECDDNNSVGPPSNYDAQCPRNAKCCGNAMFYSAMQLCCGPKDNKKLHDKESRDDLCCGREKYDPKTQHCCLAITGELEVRDVKFSDKQLKQKEDKPNCIEPNTSRCGAQCYNADTHDCCHKDQRRTGAPWSSASDQPDANPTVYSPNTHFCWDGRLSARTPGINQLCGNRGDYLCGTECFRPSEEICCDGQRHPNGPNIACCGSQAYNIKDQWKKCCAKTLHNLTTAAAANVRCCGSSLQNLPNQVCCSGKDKEVLHSAKTGFSCCGHFYYDASLKWCCAERPFLRSDQSPNELNRDFKLQSINSLNKTHLCNKMYTGILESVSPRGIVFNSVLKIHGRNASVTLHSHHVLHTADGCTLPQLSPGKQYLFDERHVFVDFNHDNVHQSLVYIFSECLA